MESGSRRTSHHIMKSSAPYVQALYSSSHTNHHLYSAHSLSCIRIPTRLCLLLLFLTIIILINSFFISAHQASQASQRPSRHQHQSEHPQQYRSPSVQPGGTTTSQVQSTTSHSSSSSSQERAPLTAQITPQGEIIGLDRSSLIEGISDAQQQLRQADIQQRHELSAAHQQGQQQQHLNPSDPSDSVSQSETSPSNDNNGDSSHQSDQHVAAEHADQNQGVDNSEDEHKSDVESMNSTPDDSDNNDADLSNTAIENTNERINQLLIALDSLTNDDNLFTDADLALELLSEAASLGSSTAHTELGRAYLFGDSIPRNMTLALLHLTAAANMGNATAQHYLAFLYSLHLHPDSSNYNIPLSVLYDYFAALGGEVGAKLSLAYRHYYGYGVPQSCSTSGLYYRDVAQSVVNALSHASFNHMMHIDRSHLLDDNARVSQMEDSAEVLQYYQHSADSGNVEAQVALGQLHYHGHRGLPHSPQLAQHYFNAAAAAGDSTAMTALGQMHLQGLITKPSGTDIDGNKTALQLFYRAAEMGNAAAQTSLGLVYLQGGIADVSVNYTAALQWFTRAAVAGHPEAQFQLGVMHFTELGVQRDLAKAFELFRASALQGHTKALFNVAQMQTHGLGTELNCADGVMKLKVVAERGEWSQILSIGHNRFLSGDYEAAFLYYALAAHEGHETGQANAAYLIHHGYVDMWGQATTSALTNETTQITTAAIEQTNEQQTNLQQATSDQTAATPLPTPPTTTVPSDTTTSNSPVPSSSAAPLKYSIAYQLYSLSADQSNVDSMRMLGDYAYYALLPFPDPYSTAARHYAHAGEKESAQSLFNLGYLYHQGLGVTRDYHLAKRYYDRAIAVDPQAYVPCTLALIKLWIDQKILEWQQPTTTTTTTTTTAIPTTTSSTSSPSSTSSSSESSLSSFWDYITPSSAILPSFVVSFWSYILSLPCWSWSWHQWYETIENLTLIVATISLAFFIYRRAQRL